MISILIPVYNRDVNQLAATLSGQLAALDKPGEIILLDDGSAETFRKANAATSSLAHVRYIESNTNHGRLRVRQLLSQKAHYDWLLFLDSDSMIVSELYLQNYFMQAVSNPGVFVGGRIYSQAAPSDCTLRLHWKYGTLRETADAEKRNRDPYPGFMSNNFMVHRSVFERLSFVSDWQGYGHEDTWMGMQLEKLRAPVTYIDNVVVHDGLETSAGFLEKTEQALQNLKKLEELVPPELLRRHVKLFRVYSRLRSANLLWAPRLAYRMMRSAMEKNLHSCEPSLYYFDLYRLNRFIELSGPQK